MAKPTLRFAYTGLRVRDLRRSLAFYRGLGFRIHHRGTMGHGGVWVQLVHGDGAHRLELNFYPRGTRFHEPYRAGTELDHLGFFTPDVDHWIRTARRLGAPVVEDFSEPGERLAYVADPDGVWVEFVGPETSPERRKPAVLRRAPRGRSRATR